MMTTCGRGEFNDISVSWKDITLVPHMVHRRDLASIGSNIYTCVEFQEVIDAVAHDRTERLERPRPLPTWHLRGA